MKNRKLKKIVATFYIIIVVIVATSCKFLASDSHINQEIPNDAPLSEFILGEWTTEHVYMSNGNESPFGFDINFKDYDTVEVVVKENGEPTDMTVSQYSFIDSTVIFVDNKRIRGGETWYLERKDQQLSVFLDIDDGKEGITLILVRR